MTLLSSGITNIAYSLKQNSEYSYPADDEQIEGSPPSFISPMSQSEHEYRINGLMHLIVSSSIIVTNTILLFFTFFV